MLPLLACALCSVSAASIAAGSATDAASDASNDGSLPRSVYQYPKASSSGRFTGLDRALTQPLNRVEQAASQDRLNASMDPTISYYPLDTGLWASVNSQVASASGFRFTPSNLMDVHFSSGKPAGASSDPNTRALWQSYAASVDHESLSRAIYGGVVAPIEATNIRQLHRASQPISLASTAAMSSPTTQPASVTLNALPFVGYARLRPAPAVRQPASASMPAADSMEHPDYRAARLRAIASGAASR